MFVRAIALPIISLDTQLLTLCALLFEPKYPVNDYDGPLGSPSTPSHGYDRLLRACAGRQLAGRSESDLPAAVTASVDASMRSAATIQNADAAKPESMARSEPSTVKSKSSKDVSASSSDMVWDVMSDKVGLKESQEKMLQLSQQQQAASTLAAYKPTSAAVKPSHSIRQQVAASEPRTELRTQEQSSVDISSGEARYITNVDPMLIAYVNDNASQTKQALPSATIKKPCHHVRAEQALQDGKAEASDAISSSSASTVRLLPFIYSDPNIPADGAIMPFPKPHVLPAVDPAVAFAGEPHVGAAMAAIASKLGAVHHMLHHQDAAAGPHHPEMHPDHFPMHHIHPSDPSYEGWLAQRASSSDGTIEVEVLVPGSTTTAAAASEPANVMHYVPAFDEPEMDLMMAGMRLLVGQGALLLVAVGLLLAHTCLVERRLRRLEDAQAAAAAMATTFYLPICDKV